MEYIKRTAVFEQFDNADADVCETDDFGGVDYGFGMKNIKELINAIPAADVVPVVRCKGCKHYDMGVCLKIYSDGNAHSEAWQSRRPEDFCSYGDRKGKNETERT